MVYTGKDSYVYFAIETGFKNGGAGMAALNHHIAFNPLEKFEPAEPNYSIEAIKTMNSLVDSIKYTSQLTPGEATLDGFFRDPWLLLNIFPKVQSSGLFSDSGCISGNFDDETNRKSIMVQYHNHDRGAGAQHIDETLIGGKINKYSWKVTQGKPLKEEANIKSADFVTGNIKAFTGTTNFDNGSFSNWSTSGIVHAKDITITFDGHAISGLNIRELDLSLDFEGPQDHTMSSFAANVEYDGNRKYVANIKGFLTGTAEVNEIKSAYEARTVGTLIVSCTYNNSTGTQALQFTNAYLKEMDNYAINPAAEAYEVSFMFEDATGSELSYVGSFNALSAMTGFVSGTHTDVLP